MEREKLFQNLVKGAFVVLVLQSFYLQVIRWNWYAALSRKNCIRTIEIGIPRGDITDRNGRPLAQDIPCFNIVYIPYDLKSPAHEAEILASVTGMDRGEIVRVFSRTYRNPFDRIVLKKRISPEEVSKIEENAIDLPGVFVQAGIDRSYLLGDKLCHILGYVGEISPEQLERMKEGGFKAGYIIGQFGLEKKYDDVLRGIPGGIQVEVDALGHQRRVLGTQEMKPGNKMILTVDQVIQDIAFEELGGESGCVVALDPRNGEVLALASRPGFDPGDVGMSLGKPGHPFLNRAIQAQYPPGSIFKIVTETAALESNAIAENDRIECRGEMTIGNTVFHCWKDDGHGWIDINQALPFSCNIFFGTAGMKTGVEKMEQYARMYGFGEPTGIDLDGEKSGNLPSLEDSGGPLNLAIGQGALLTTPMQLAVLIATVANGGDVWKPFIVRKIIAPDGQVVKEFQPVLQKTAYISAETLEVLRRGLKNVVAIGTGGGARVENITVAGKTGTAQRAQSDLELSTHGGFACYASAEEPTIALVVFLDSAASSQAARIAGNILRRVFFPPAGDQTDGETGIVQETEE